MADGAPETLIASSPIGADHVTRLLVCLTLLSLAAGLLMASGSRGAAQAPDLSAVLARPILRPGVARVDLRAFLDARVPPMKPPSSAQGWRRESDGLRRRLLREVVFRGVPREWTAAGEARAEWGERISQPGYTIRKLRYEAVPGMWIPALLYEPDGLAKRLPAVLNVNGHVGAPGKAIAYEQIRCINLAKRGMIALHPEWLNCGELSGSDYRHNRLAYLDLCGRSGLSVFYLAMRRGLDILERHPRADSRRLAMTGLSGGGWQTIWLSALDRRIAATAPNAGYIGMPERIRNGGDIGDLEQNPTDMLRIADYPQMTAMLAPRPALLIYNERDDCCFPTPRARPSVFEPVVRFYTLFGRTERFRFHNNTVPGTHNYDRDNREQFYRFLNDVFRPETDRRDAEIDVESEVLPIDSLRAGVPEGNRGFGHLAEQMLADLPRRSTRHSRSAALAEWRSERVARLGDLLRIPQERDVRVVRTAAPEAGPDGVTVVRRTLRIGRVWTLPAVEVGPSAPVGTALVVSESGRAAAGESVSALLKRGLRVIAVDLALSGECDPAQTAKWQQAIMIGAAGERLLGIQTSQLLAVADWARREFGVSELTLAGTGRAGAAAALMAAALRPEWVRELKTEGLPASLKDLIRQRVEFEECPELFCFGLLEHFDIPDLLELARR